MTTKQEVLNKLNVLKKRHKFSISAWNARGLNPSDDVVCNQLEGLFNLCAENLIIEIESNSSPRKLKKVLKKGLSNFKRFEYDTEEREFILDYFYELSQIISVDFKKEATIWMYGRMIYFISFFFTFLRGKEKIVETLTQDCTNCHTKLETFITQKQNGLPDTNWFIVHCNTCNEYNLISLSPNIKQLKYTSYTVVEKLYKDEFNEEQANIRLEQIKYYRKK